MLLDKRQSEDVPAPEIPDEIDGIWFETNVLSVGSGFQKKTVASENGVGTVCCDDVYYDLGYVYMKVHRLIEAGMCFRGFLERVGRDKNHMFVQSVQGLAAEAREKITPSQPKE
jgi:hypothetical protein